MVENDLDHSKVDYADITLSTVNPFRKFGFAGRAVTEGINAFVDVKFDVSLDITKWSARISLADFIPIEGNEYISKKSDEDVKVDFMFGYTKSGVKETMSQFKTNSKMGDFAIDVISGKLKQYLKKKVNETK